VHRLIWAMLTTGFYLAMGVLSTAADNVASHRVVLVGRQVKDDPLTPRIEIVEIETERAVARALTGRVPDVAVSPDGGTIAVLSDRPASGGGVLQQLELYDATNLKPVSRGAIPLPDRVRYGIAPQHPFLTFASGGGELIAQCPLTFVTDGRPLPQAFQQVWVARLNLAVGPYRGV
jgi:hypothetical protein